MRVRFFSTVMVVSATVALFSQQEATVGVQALKIVSDFDGEHELLFPPLEVEEKKKLGEQVGP